MLQVQCTQVSFRPFMNQNAASANDIRTALAQTVGSGTTLSGEVAGFEEA
jgi:hypothetical protein